MELNCEIVCNLAIRVDLTNDNRGVLRCGLDAR